MLLADGSIAVVRPLCSDDGPALHELHGQVSDEAIRLRFFSVSRHAVHAYVDHVMADPGTLALIAERQGRLIGLATAEPMGPSRSEIAFLVDDGARGLGVGTLLLEHLAALARSRGITSFEADVLAENHAMLTVFSDAGFTSQRNFDLGTVVLTLGDRLHRRVDGAGGRSGVPGRGPVAGPVAAAWLAGSGRCARRRDRHRVHGAPVDRRRWVHRSSGRDPPARPQPRRRGHLPIAPRRAGPLDLVVICVPAPLVLDVFRDAVAAGVRAAVIVSSGFGELGAEGARAQHDITALARAHDVRVVGPNCLGLLCNHPDIRLNATFHDAVPPSGGLAVASQSGGVGIVLMDLARELDLGVHTFVSLGNKADVSSNDLLAAWYADPDVTAAALYLESFGNSAKFARFARRFAERKPLLAVVGGRSAGGSRAGASHTAAAASPGVGVDALFAQAGVIGCRDAEDLARTAKLLAEQPLPAGRRLAILSNAGGMGVLAADAAAAEGLEVPEFSPALQEQLAALVHGTSGTSNPVDAGAGVSPAQLAELLNTILDAREVDAVLVVPVATGVTDGSATMSELARARAAHPDLPVLAVPLGGLPAAPPGEHPITSYRTTASALRTLARCVRYGEWLAIHRTEPARTEPELAVQLRARAQELLADSVERWLTPGQAAELLAAYDIDVQGSFAESAASAVSAARRCGFPVAIKITDPSVVHKTELGLVRTGLRTQHEVRTAYRHFRDVMGHAPEVLVQPMVSGTELAVGLVRDPSLGPLVMVAAGGVATDIWDDRAFLLPPISSADATRAVSSLRIAPLLSGFRGAPAGDLTGLEALVVALGRLALDVPEIAELDLNPVVVGPSGCAVIDVKVRLSIPVGPDAAAPRQLRPVP